MKSVIIVFALFLPSLDTRGIAGWSDADVATTRVKIEALADYYDVNKSGNITIDDYDYVMDRLENFNHISDDKKAQVKTFITNWWRNSMDVSAETTLTKGQYVARIFTLIENGHMIQVTREYRSTIFGIIDADNDQKINLSEFLEFAESLGYTHNEKQTKAFKTIDKSGEGHVTSCEYITAYVMYFTDPTVTYDGLPLF